MKFKPVAHRLIVVPITLEEEVSIQELAPELAAKNFVVRSGMEHKDSKYMKESLDRGKVVEIGWMCWKHSDYGYINWLPESVNRWLGWKPWCQIGDRVLFGKHAGKLEIDPVTEEEFMILNDEDIQVILED